MNDSIAFFASKATPRTILARSLLRSLLTTSLLATASFSAIADTPPAKPIAKPMAGLTFLTWGEYIDEDIVKQFESEHDAKVNFVYFESDEGREEILTTSGHENYDIILVDSVSIPFYNHLEWITEFDQGKAPNLKHVKLPTLAGLEGRDQTCTPYAWGTTGIAYRGDLVSEPITTWKQLFAPKPELKGKILMLPSGDEVIGMALKSLGYSMSSGDKNELDEARALLLTQVPSVMGYSAVAVESDKSKLVTGEASALITYSGDALKLKEYEPKIEYVLPDEGGPIWADFICLSSKAKNSKLAHDFVNFINRPVQAAQNALFVYSGTPNTAAEKLLPEEFLSNPIIYPNQEILARSELYQPLSLRAVKRHSSIMNELRQALENN